MPHDCHVCSAVANKDLIELDLLLADPATWPANTFEPLPSPKGSLSARMRKLGALRLGSQLLAARGYTGIGDQALLRHIRYDVALIARSPDELVASGLLQEGGYRPEPIDPLAYLRYYAKGVALGIRGLALLEERLDEMIAAGEEIPVSLLTKLVDSARALATSQAAIRAAGKPWGEGDSEEGFRAGSAPVAGPRIGNSRARVIEGETRMVQDRGPADREAYNRRARREGSPTI